MIYDFASKERNNTTKEKSQEIGMVIENESQDIVHSSTPRPLLPLNLSLLVLNRLGTNSQTMRTAMEYAFRDKGQYFLPPPPPLLRQPPPTPLTPLDSCAREIDRKYYTLPTE